MADIGGTTSNTTTGTEGAIFREPVVFDYSQINQFKVYVPLFPITTQFSFSLMDQFKDFKILLPPT